MCRPRVRAGSAAAFDVSGHHLLSYGIVLPTSVTVSSGANTMSIDGFTTDKPGNVGTLPGGADSFRIGATLNVGPSQATGSYTGTFDVSVACQ